MSVYQKEKPEFLRESMESIYDQTIPTDDFVLICDGPLTEELDGVIEEMQNKFGERLRVIRQEENRGLGYSLNLGVKECKNELIARMDSDDISVVDRIEKQLRILENSGVDVVGSCITEYDEDMKQVLGVRNVPGRDEEIKKYARRRNPVNHMSIILRKSKVIDAGNYKEMPGFEDYYLWIRMMKKDCKFYNVQDSLVKVRGGDAMVGRRGGWLYFGRMKEFEKILKKMDFISTKEYYENIAIRSFSSLAPSWMRSGLYRKVLRSSG